MGYKYDMSSPLWKYVLNHAGCTVPTRPYELPGTVCTLQIVFFFFFRNVFASGGLDHEAKIDGFFRGVELR